MTNIEMKVAQTHNKVLPKAELNVFDLTMVQGLTSVLRINLCTKNTRLHKAAERQAVKIPS